MLKLIYLFLIFLFINLLVLNAHKDRIEFPKSYIFIFKDNKSLKVTNSKDPMLKVYSKDILNKNQKIKMYEIYFSSGEKLTLESNGKKWTQIYITHNNKKLVIPNYILKKIPKINFETIALLWNGNYKNSFNSNYFYLQFDIGSEKTFDKLPYLKLIFADNEFSNAEIYQQTDWNTTQIKDF